MALEQEIQKLTAAVEKLTALLPVSTLAPLLTEDSIKKSKKVIPPPAVEQVSDPFAATEKSEVTLEKLTELLKIHAKTFGTQVTVTLMRKHGAHPTETKLTTIPQASYEACFAEAEAELKKAKKV